MRDDLTIIYYTANAEDRQFELRITDHLIRQANGIPIVSVSHKPMLLGKNICVGDVDTNHYNGKRQILLGCQEAKTRYVCMAEADFLYPQDYFDYLPPTENAICYAKDSLYVIWHYKPKFYLKTKSDGLMMINREYFIKVLEEALNPKMEWWDGEGPHPKMPGLNNFSALDSGNRVPFRMKNPALTFKTGNGVSVRCPYKKEGATRVLPYWGKAKTILRDYI